MTDLSKKEIKAKIASVEHWYHRIEVAPGIVTPGINASKECLALLPLPADCKGLRALDLGARDGFYSFELERRGAEVVAIDYLAPTITGFNVAKELVGSKVECLVDNIYDLSESKYGRFDIILFLGLLYHLRDPLLALDRIWDVAAAKAELYVESQVIDNAFLDKGGKFVPLSSLSPELPGYPIMQFYPKDTLSGDHSNWWAPNMSCLKHMLESSNFAVEYERLNGTRGIVKARRADDPETAYHRRIEKSTISGG